MNTQIIEDALDEVLDIVQRQKRAQITRANKKKLEIARKVARGKMASQKNLKKRAYAQARKIVRRKFAGKRGEEYESLGPAEKMVIDKAVEGKVKLIRKLAARLLPRIQQAEAKRLSSFMKGHQLQNLGAKERRTMNEEVNKKFATKFKGVKAKKAASQIKIYNKFSEEAMSESSIYKSLLKKSNKSGLDIDLLGEVFDRGLEAWAENQKVSREQYAFARVNSYINQGKSYFNEDADLAEKYKAPMFDRTPPKVGSEHKIEHEGLNKKDIHKVTASEDGYVYFTNTRTKEIYNTNVRHFNNIRRPLKEELEEGKNTPSVKKIKGLSGQDTWKAMNKHGKTQFFNNPVSAHRHAGIPHEVKEDLDEAIKGKWRKPRDPWSPDVPTPKEALHPITGKIMKSHPAYKEYVKKHYHKNLWAQHGIKEELGPENDIGTDALVKKCRLGTPGQENAETHENKKPKFPAEGPKVVKEEINVSTASADKKVVKVTGPDGQSHWRKIRRKQDLVKDETQDNKNDV